MYTVDFPIQPIGLDHTGQTARFKENEFLSYMVHENTQETTADLNAMACKGFPSVDYAHFSMLTGYSVDGWGYMSDASRYPDWVNEADAEVAKMSDGRVPDLTDLVSLKPHPVIEFDFDKMRFVKNQCVDYMVGAYGYRRMCKRINHIYGLHSDDEFSQILQLLGLTIDEYMYTMDRFTSVWMRRSPETHYNRTLAYLKSFGYTFKYSNGRTVNSQSHRGLDIENILFYDVRK